MRQAYKVWIAVAAAVFCLVALVDLTTGTASRPAAARSVVPPTSTTLPSTTVPAPAVLVPVDVAPSTESPVPTTTPVTTTTPVPTTTSAPNYGGYDSGGVDGPSPGDQGLPDGALTGGYCARKWWC